jgi:hypothetical protein
MVLTRGSRIDSVIQLVWDTNWLGRGRVGITAWNLMLGKWSTVTVQALLDRWPWKPLRNCPGRFVLVTEDKFMSLTTLLEPGHYAQTFISAAANDPVIVVPLEDGGLISYARPDRSFVHTLNTSEGFARKLSQLGIGLEGQKP